MIRPVLLAASALALAWAPPAAAQDDRRLSSLEKTVRELRSIVFQGRDTGQPVVVKPEGPDPQVVALEQKVNDLEQTLQRVNGQLDTATHDLDDARRGLADLRATDAEQARALTDRIARLEALGAAAAPVAAPPPPPGDAAPSSQPGPTRSGDATARAQAGDAGTMGGAAGGADPAPARPAALPEPQAYKAARALLAAGDYPGAASAFQAYATRFPASPRIAEARYWLGEALFIQDSFPDAARAYAQALRGWPKTGWAPEATIKLAQSLAQANVADKACLAVGEFDRRYAAVATTASKARAKAVRAQAKCPA